MIFSVMLPVIVPETVDLLAVYPSMEGETTL
jgi:hypothetical protein